MLESRCAEPELAAAVVLLCLMVLSWPLQTYSSASGECAVQAAL